MQFSVGNLLILVKIRDRSVQLAGLRVCLLRQLLGLTSLGACLLCLLICRIRRALRLVNTSLGTAVYVFNVVRVLSSELIQLVQPVFYRSNLPIYPLFAGQGIQFSPETLGGLSRKRLSSSVSRRICCCTRRTGGGRVGRGRSGAGLRSAAVRRRSVLRHGRHAQAGGQQDRSDRSRGYSTFCHDVPLSAQNEIWKKTRTPVASALARLYCKRLAKQLFSENKVIILLITGGLLKPPDPFVDISQNGYSSEKRALFSSR